MTDRRPHVPREPAAGTAGDPLAPREPRRGRRTAAWLRERWRWWALPPVLVLLALLAAYWWVHDRSDVPWMYVLF